MIARYASVHLAGRYVITERMNIQSIRAGGPRASASSSAPIDIRARARARTHRVRGRGAFCQRRGNESRCFRVRFLRGRLPREGGLTATYEGVTYSVIIQRRYAQISHPLFYTGR